MNAQKNNSPNHWLTRLVLVLGKTVDQLLWQHFKKTTGNCQHGFSKGERRLAHLIAFGEVQAVPSMGKVRLQSWGQDGLSRLQPWRFFRPRWM